MASAGRSSRPPRCSLWNDARPFAAALNEDALPDLQRRAGRPRDGHQHTARSADDDLLSRDRRVALLLHLVAGTVAAQAADRPGRSSFRHDGGGVNNAPLPGTFTVVSIDSYNQIVRMRADDGYVVTIRSADAGGKPEAGYANPVLLPFAVAQASREAGAIKVFLDLRAAPVLPHRSGAATAAPVHSCSGRDACSWNCRARISSTLVDQAKVSSPDIAIMPPSRRSRSGKWMPLETVVYCINA